MWQDLLQDGQLDSPAGDGGFDWEVLGRKALSCLRTRGGRPDNEWALSSN